MGEGHLAKWFPLTPWFPSASFHQPLSACLPHFSPLRVPPHCLLGFGSLDSLLGHWWHKYRHNHMFFCGIRTMSKFFCLSRMFLSFLVLYFERVGFLGLFPIVCSYSCCYLCCHSRIYEAQRGISISLPY